MARSARPGWLQAAISARRSWCRGDARRVDPFDWGTELPNSDLRLESAGGSRIRLKRPQRRARHRRGRRYAADYTAGAGDVNANAHGRGAYESFPHGAASARAFPRGVARQAARMACGGGLHGTRRSVHLALQQRLARIPGDAQVLPDDVEELPFEHLPG